jgi:hypothetical protein
MNALMFGVVVLAAAPSGATDGGTAAPGRFDGIQSVRVRTFLSVLRLPGSDATADRFTTVAEIALAESGLTVAARGGDAVLVFDIVLRGVHEDAMASTHAYLCRQVGESLEMLTDCSWVWEGDLRIVDATSATELAETEVRNGARAFARAMKTERSAPIPGQDEARLREVVRRAEAELAEHYRNLAELERRAGRHREADDAYARFLYFGHWLSPYIITEPRLPMPAELWETPRGPQP